MGWWWVSWLCCKVVKCEEKHVWDIGKKSDFKEQCRIQGTSRGKTCEEGYGPTTQFTYSYRESKLG